MPMVCEGGKLSGMNRVTIKRKNTIEKAALHMYKGQPCNIEEQL